MKREKKKTKNLCFCQNDIYMSHVAANIEHWWVDLETFRLWMTAMAYKIFQGVHRWEYIAVVSIFNKSRKLFLLYGVQCSLDSPHL